MQGREGSDAASLAAQPAAGPPDVLLVVVTYNSARDIEALIDSIPPSIGNLTPHVVVVDNGSADGTRDIVRSLDGVELIESTNIGYAGGLNLGIRSSRRTETVVVLNPDCLLAPGSILRLVGALTKARVGIAVPLVRGPDGRRVDSLRREPTILRALGLNRTGAPRFSEYVVEESAYSHPAIVDWATGAAMAFRRELWDELGGWDPSFFLYSEETDFCLRARDAGWATVFVPSASVMHVGGGSGRDEKTHTMLIINRVRLYARRHGRAQTAGYWLVTVASELSWWIRGQAASRTAVRALLRPSVRPAELRAGARIVPRG